MSGPAGGIPTPFSEPCGGGPRRVFQTPPLLPQRAPRPNDGLPRPALTATSGPHQGQVFTFDAHDIFLFGRSKTRTFRCATIIARPIHFLIEVNPPQCRLTDMGSRNGTFVTVSVVQFAELSHGDQIRAGHTTLVLTLPPDVAPQEADPEEKRTLDLPPDERVTNLGRETLILPKPPRPPLNQSLGTVAPAIPVVPLVSVAPVVPFDFRGACGSRSSPQSPRLPRRKILNCNWMNLPPIPLALTWIR